jgi:ketosteroid isomerase-like protein
MSAEQNKQRVLAFFHANATQNVAIADGFVTDDCQFWAPGFGHFSRATFEELVAKMRPILPHLPVVTVVDMTAEGDRVAVEGTGSGKLADGRVYENTYHFLFRFRDGRICEMKEYMDSKRVADMFGSIFG